MWGWAILSILLGVAFRRAYDASDLSPILTRRSRARAAAGLSAFAFLVMLLLASATDGAWLWKGGWEIYSAIVSPRFVTCITGFLVGLLLSGTDFLKQVAAILLPIPGWAVATTVGIFLIIGVVLATNPGLFESLQSFKAAGVEATFASRAANVRETEIHLRDIAEKLTLEDYIGFEENFNPDDAPRRKAILWFDKSPLKEGPAKTAVKESRLRILRVVFHNFVNPIVLGLGCLNEKDALEAAKRQDSLADLAIGWQHFLLDLNSPSASKRDPFDAFGLIIKRSLSFIDYVQEVGKGCSTYSDVTIADENTLKGAVQEIRTAFADTSKALMDTDDKFLGLTAMEPYVVGVVGDLIGFVFSEKDKADFLARMAKDFPATDDRYQIGMVNFFYQTADAKVQSEGTWPVDEVVKEVDYALRAADYFAVQSSKWKQEHTGSEFSKDRETAGKVFETYNVNTARILALYLGVYNQRALRGDPISEAHLHQWTKMLGRLLAISHARLRDSLPIEGVPEGPLDSDTAKQWPTFAMPDRFLIDVNVSIALSLVLRHRDEQRSASECAAARYYVKNADQNRAQLFSDGSINVAEAARLEQFIRSVGYRVGSYCAQRN